MQFLEQYWESLLHSRPKRLQSLAQATPGKEAKAAPRRAPPIHLIALPLERVPLASPLASSSKVRLVVCWLTRRFHSDHSPLSLTCHLYQKRLSVPRTNTVNRPSGVRVAAGLLVAVPPRDSHPDQFPLRVTCQR
jgi:hypothetical protein